MNTLSEILQLAKQTLFAERIETAALDARILVQHVCNITHADIIARPNLELSSDKVAAIGALVKRRAGCEPVSKILGYKEFYGRNFTVSVDTLDPRPDTEVLIEQALKWARAYNQAPKILDLGTGTGCIALTLLSELPQATAVCADVSGKALKIADKNAKALGVSERVSFVESDWFENISESFDLIVSNPPYISESDIESLSQDVREFDPILALDGGSDGLNPYKIIFSELNIHLNYGGAAFFEFGISQSEDISRLVKEARIRMVGITPDIAGIPRVVEIMAGEK